MGRRGQGVLEYVVLLVALAAAFLIMQRVMKGSIMGSWKEAADAFGGGLQYEPSGPKKTKRLISVRSNCVFDCRTGCFTSCDDAAFDPINNPRCSAEVVAQYCTAAGFEQFD